MQSKAFRSLCLAAVAAAALVVFAAGLAAQEDDAAEPADTDTEPEAPVIVEPPTDVAIDAIRALYGGDTEALKSRLHNASLLVLQAAAPDGSTITAWGQGAGQALAGQPASSDAGLNIAILDDRTELYPEVAFIGARVSGLGQTPGAVIAVAALVLTETSWRVVFLGAIPEQAAGDTLPEDAAYLVACLAEGETTGMQAALGCLPKGPCVFVAAGPEYLFPMAGAAEIVQTVESWPLPANVVVEAEPRVMVAGDVAIVMRSSSFDELANHNFSRDMLCLANEDGEWKVSVFIARSATGWDGSR